jgi:hypothetical protein
MRRSGTGSGGGYHTRQHVEKPVRTGSGSHGVRPAYTNMPGAMQGNKVTSMRGTTDYTSERRETARSFNPVKYGNELALNSKSAPGQGRTHYHCGSQGVHGSTNPGSPRPNPQRDAVEGE